jgi:NAD(P)-dependent dehydrogenase (short-subunit alcohol dehydrogenase family)
MAARLKPLARQTILITGASSGIGLATARMAAGRGAAVVLVARDEAGLEQAVQSIRDAGGRAEHHVADVADRAALEAAADKAERAFGGLDSWVNDAGASIYGTLEDTPVEDQKRLFDTNYWGVVHGSLIAAQRLRGRGGAIVNVGSVLSDRAVPFQGTYCATKHAVKAFTDTLRMELEMERAGISVTLIKPSGIDTPFQEHARIRMDTPGVKVPPPAYDPRLVARAICFACATPRRDLVIGAGGAVIGLAGALFPRATDLVMEAIGRPAQVTEEAGRPGMRDNLYEARPGGDERSSLPGMPQRRTSLLLEAQMHPLATMATLAGAGVLALGAVAARRAVPGRMGRTAPGLAALLPRIARRPARRGWL